MHCPSCESIIPSENINIHTDVGQCPRCKYVFKVSQAIAIDDWDIDRFDINQVPKGAWLKQDVEITKIGATTRSPIAFFLVPFMLVWSGGSLGGIYGSQIEDGELDVMMSLFGIPFVIGSIIFWALTLMAIWGKVEVTLTNGGGKVFTGIGPIGLTKQFSLDEISRVTEKTSNIKYPGSQGAAIVLEGKKRISFGTGLREARRYYLYKTLKVLIEKSNMYRTSSRF